MSDETRISNAGAVALEGGTVNVSGLLAAGRDVFVEEVNILVADRAPSGASLTVPGHTGDICPFPGLDPFGAGDAEFFFGRDEDARIVRELAVVGKLAAVVGSSGSGKSSLLAAAVVPALAAGGMDRSPSLPIVVKPGRTPVELIADRLAQHLPSLSAARIADEIRVDPRALATTSDKAAHAAGKPVIWVVDQFEEVFDPAVPDADRQVLLEGLRPGMRSGVLLAMRSDFYRQLDASPDLAQLVAARQYRLTPLGEAGLRDVVVRPAERVHLRVEPGLVEQIGKDAQRSGGALPFVAMALKETWRGRVNGWLTVAGYVAGGGVSGAIQLTADSAWERLAPADQATARRMLLRMAHVTADGAVTRRRCPATEFITGLDDQDAVLRVLQVLVRSRLLTMDATQTPSGDQDSHSLPVPTVEIAHEALLTAWPRLREWLAADRDAQRVQDDLASAAIAWKQSGFDPAFLYTGVRLATLVSTRESLTPNANEAEFIRASTRLAGRQRRRGRLLVALPIGLVLALVIAGLAVGQQRSTEQAKTLSDALQLAAEARAEVTDNRDLAALLAVAADRTRHNPTTWGTLVDTLGSTGGPVTWARPVGGPVNAIAPQFTASGEVATAGSDGVAYVRSPGDGRPTERITSGLGLVDVKVSGPYVVTADVTGSLTLVAPSRSPRLLLRISGEASTWDLALDSRKGLIAAAGSDGRLRRWWYSIGPSGAHIVSSRTDPIAASSLAIDPSGAVLASTLAGSVYYLPDEDQRRAPTRLLADRSLSGGLNSHLVLNRKGRLAAVDGSDLTVWDLTTRSGHPVLRRPQQVTYNGGSAIAADPSTGDLVTATLAGVVTQWSVTSVPARQVTLTGGGTEPVRGLATNGRWVVARTDAGALVSWDLSSRSSPAASPLPAGKDEPSSVAYGPEGALAIGGGNGQITILPDAGHAADRAPVGIGGLPGTRVVAVAWWGRRLVAGGGDGSVAAFDPDGGRTTLDPGRQMGVSGLAAAAGRLAIAWTDGRIEVIGPEGQAHLTGAHSSDSVALSNDGRWLASGTSDPDGYDVLLWDLGHPGEPRRLHGHHLFVSALAFSPDGQTLASGSDDQDIRLWSTGTGRELGTLTGHRDTIRALAFAADGETLASTGDEASLRLWDLRTSSQIGHPLPIGDLALLSLAVSPDGDRIVAAGNGQITAVPLGDGAWRSRACSFAGRALTAAERARYLPDRPAQAAAVCS